MKQDDLQLAIEQAENKEKLEDFFGAAFMYKEALELAIKHQDSKSIKLCKKKIVEMNKKSIASGDFKEVEFTHNLSEENQEGLEKYINAVLDQDNVNKILKIIGTHPFFFPKVKEVEELAAKTMPISYQIATLATVSDSGHTVSGGSLGEYKWFMEMYSMSQQTIMTMYLDRIIWQLINSKSRKNKMTLKKLGKYFESTGIISPEKMIIISKGLKHYFKNDFISAVHILVPQFEALFLDIAQRCGIDIFALDKKRDTATRTLTLSDYHLDTPEFKNIFGEDFCRQIKFILFEPLGYKLRHKIAHGEIQPAECNFRNTNLIIYLYLVLLSRIEIRDKQV